jgi:hypothetical protein
MAKNDTILLDGIIAKRIEDSLPSKDKGEVFEYFAFEQILKDYDLSADEINYRRPPDVISSFGTPTAPPAPDQPRGQAWLSGPTLGPLAAQRSYRN